MARTNEEIKSALLWFGIVANVDDCDRCEDGSVWFGLTQILPKTGN